MCHKTLNHFALNLAADSSTEITMTPQPTEAEIQFILDAISEYLTVKVGLRAHNWSVGLKQRL